MITETKRGRKRTVEEKRHEKVYDIGDSNISSRRMRERGAFFHRRNLWPAKPEQENACSKKKLYRVIVEGRVQTQVQKESQPRTSAGGKNAQNTETRKGGESAKRINALSHQRKGL